MSDIHLLIEHIQPTASSNKSGFTLIESVVSVSIFAVTVVSILGVYTAVQKLNKQSASLTALQQNTRFITEDITKLIRNGQIDYARYGASVPQPTATNLYILGQDDIPVRVYQNGNNLTIERSGIGSSVFSGLEVKVLDFKVYIWPATDPFPGGMDQPTVTVFLNLESSINARDKITLPFQVSVATREYQE